MEGGSHRSLQRRGAISDQSDSESASPHKAESEGLQIDVFPDIASARNYLVGALENFDYICTHENDKLRMAIEFLTHSDVTASEDSKSDTEISFPMRWAMFFGTNTEYLLGKSHHWIGMNYSVHFQIADEIDYGTSFFEVNKVVGYGPETISEQVQREEVPQRLRLFRRKKLMPEEVERPTRPEERTEPILKTMGTLYVYFPAAAMEHEVWVEGFKKVKRDSYWILEVRDKDCVEDAKELVGKLAESFPKVFIEIRLNFQRKTKGSALRYFD